MTANETTSRHHFSAAVAIIGYPLLNWCTDTTASQELSAFNPRNECVSKSRTVTSSTTDYCSRAIYISNLLTALLHRGAFEQRQDCISHTLSPLSPYRLSRTGRQNTTSQGQAQWLRVGHDRLAHYYAGSNDNINLSTVRDFSKQFIMGTSNPFNTASLLVLWSTLQTLGSAKNSAKYLDFFQLTLQII